MKNNLLYLAILFCVFLYVDTIWARIVVIIVGMVFYYFRYQTHALLITFLFIAIAFISLVIPTPTPSTILRVQQIKTNYIVASDGVTKCLLYNVEDVVIDDVVKVRGTFESIYSTRNKDTFQFQKQMARRNIHTSMYTKAYTVEEVGTTLKANVFRYINHMVSKKSKENALKVLYRIDEEKEEYAHYLYASGIHFSFLIRLISKRKKHKRNEIAIGLCILYSLCFPAAFFIQRIFIFSLIPILFGKYNAKDQLGISMLCTLFIQPAMLYEMCFVLPVLFRLFSLFNISRVPNKFASFLVVYPILQWYFNETNLLFLLLFPIFSMVQGFHFLATILSVIIPSLYFLCEWAATLQMLLLKGLEIEFLVQWGKPSIVWMVAWFYIVIQLLSIKQRKSGVMLMVLFCLQRWQGSLIPFYEVAFLDVGQGDSILIKEPYLGKTVLIDVAGHKKKDIAKRNIVPYLKAKGIKKIDVVIITHDDLDHSGGLASLQEEINVEKVVATKQDVPLDTISLHSLSTKEYEDKNDNSIVMFTQIYNRRLLFMGDASKQVEKNIMHEYGRLRADIVKVGHHGSKTSSDASFLKMVSANVAIISSGYQNYYGHPHEETLSNLRKTNTMYLDTQTQGSIHFYFLPFVQFMGTGSGEFGIMK